MDNIVVYCGSNLGATPEYAEVARELGSIMAGRGRRLVYGGGRIGLMGTLADAVLQGGGEVIGVIPTFLREKEVAHQGLTELIETADMPARKNKMIELGDAFIALADGIGTFEELFEVLSLAQLKQHRKPIGLLNTAGFYDPLLALLEQTAQQGFMPAANLSLLCVAEKPADLLDKLADYRPVDAPKWIQPAWLNGQAANAKALP